MELKTRDLGVIEVKKEDIVKFPDGIPGFLEEKEFVYLPLKGESPFIIMQSVNTKDLAFVTIEPGNYIQNYQFEISEQTQEKLKIEDLNDVTVFNIVTIKDDIKKATINLAAPLVVNLHENLGKQIILDENKFPVHQQLFNQNEQKTEKVVE